MAKQHKIGDLGSCSGQYFGTCHALQPKVHKICPALVNLGMTSNDYQAYHTAEKDMAVHCDMALVQIFLFI